MSDNVNSQCTDSHEIISCRPDPICTSFKTDFNDLSRVQQNASLYDGNATAYDWVGTYE